VCAFCGGAGKPRDDGSFAGTVARSFANTYACAQGKGTESGAKGFLLDS